MHTDATTRQGKSVVNNVIDILTEDNELKSICLSCSIIARDGTAEEQSMAVISSFRESGKLLEQWRETTLMMYPEKVHLYDQIPIADSMCPSKLNGGTVCSDTCTTARKHRRKLIDDMTAICISKGFTEDMVKFFQGDCNHHMRNIICNAIEADLDKFLSEFLCEDLKMIPSHLRVCCSQMNLNRTCDKEFNFCHNYVKGHGEEFHYWMRKYCPGELMLPVIRTLGGSCQDAAFEGALPIYIARKHYVAFLRYALCASEKENILQKNLFIVLSCVEMISQLCVCAIFFIDAMVSWQNT